MKSTDSDDDTKRETPKETGKKRLIWENRDFAWLWVIKKAAFNVLVNPSKYCTLVFSVGSGFREPPSMKGHTEIKRNTYCFQWRVWERVWIQFRIVGRVWGWPASDGSAESCPERGLLQHEGVRQHHENGHRRRQSQVLGRGDGWIRGGGHTGMLMHSIKLHVAWPTQGPPSRMTISINILTWTKIF